MTIKCPCGAPASTTVDTLKDGPVATCEVCKFTHAKDINHWAAMRLHCGPGATFKPQATDYIPRPASDKLTDDDLADLGDADE